MRAGFVIGSKNKGYIRFTTKDLQKLLPNSGQGWPDKEVFLFEIEYFWSDKTAVVNAVIAPCPEDIRDSIHDAAKQSKFYRVPTGKKWLVVYKKKFPFVASEIINEDEAEIKKKIQKIMEDVKPTVVDICEMIAKNFKTKSRG